MKELDAMAEDGLRYDIMVEGALRGVVRAALDVAATDGLPGEHHFYITFRTDYPDVQLADYLRERYPSEMTIVIQYQFWDLKVLDDRFEVTLSFKDKPEHLIVPYAAVSAFADPSVRFGLQFDAESEDEDDDELAPPEEANTVEAPDEPESKKESGDGNKAEEAVSEDSGETDDDEAAGKVVALDSFRKK